MTVVDTQQLPGTEDPAEQSASDNASVFDLLRKRHEGQAWAYLEEVRNGTGFGRVTRTADALAMSLFPSRGLHLHGFEVKVSRADWIKERDAPEKAEEIAKFCHYWWLVVSDPAIVKDGELPQPWGLLAKKKGKLIVVKQAPFNPDALPPTYRFLGAVFRKFGATESAIGQLAKARSDGHAEGWRQGVEHGTKHSDDGRAQGECERLQEQLDGLRASLDEFETKSGIRIGSWGLGNVAAIVRIFSAGYDSPIKKLTRLAENADAIAKAAREAADQAGVIPTNGDAA